MVVVGRVHMSSSANTDTVLCWKLTPSAGAYITRPWHERGVGGWGGALKAPVGGVRGAG
jgi:hypothetical protein